VSVWIDPELAYLRDEPTLLAVADAAADALDQGRRNARRRRWPLAAAAAAAAAVVLVVGIAAPAFGDRLLNLFRGAPVAPRTLGPEDWRTLSVLANGFSRIPPREWKYATSGTSLHRFGFTSVSRIAVRGGRAFYVLRRSSGPSCYAIGRRNGAILAPHDTRRSLFGEVACKRGFPSRRLPILDMTGFHAGGFSPSTGIVGPSFVTRLAGFATNAIGRVGVIAMNGKTVGLTPVEDNVYINNAVPDVPAKWLIAYDRNGNLVWRECVATPAKRCRRP
jgi:hypothetical protein